MCTFIVLNLYHMTDSKVFDPKGISKNIRMREVSRETAELWRVSLTERGMCSVWYLKVTEKMLFGCLQGAHSTRFEHQMNLFIWGFTSLSTLYRSYHDG